MAPCQAKIGWKRKRKREKKKIIASFRSVPTRPVKDHSKKIAKKLRCTIMASFQAKIGWKRQRKRENKNYRSVTFLPDA